jgi:retron-type reverse transcriptase
LDHRLLREFIKQRVNDGAILRLIGKWLNAGVLEEGILTYPEKGTPQGGVVTPYTQKVTLSLLGHFVTSGDGTILDIMS